MSRKLLAGASCLLLTATLAACKENPADDTGSEPGAGAAAGDNDNVNLISNPATVPSAGDAVQVTATVKDDNNVLVADTPVEFVNPDGDSNLQVTQATTDDSGVATAVLRTESAQERSITVSATATELGETGSLTLPVTGTALEVTGPSTVSFDDASVTFTATLTNSDGAGVPNQAVTATAEHGTVTGVTDTDTEGRASITYDPPETTNIDADDLSVSALGEQGTLGIDIAQAIFRFTEPGANVEIPVNVQEPVEVRYETTGGGGPGAEVEFTVTRGEVTGTTAARTIESDGLTGGPITVESTEAGPATLTASTPGLDGPLETTRRVYFVGTTPDTISVKSAAQAIGTDEQTTITATVVDGNLNPVANTRVDFSVAGLGGGDVTQGTAVTNRDGEAQTVFEAENESGGDAMTITAEVHDDDSVPPAKTEISVVQNALGVTLGTGNEITPLPEGTDYAKSFSVIVTDAVGSPAADRTVEITITPLTYRKGAWVLTTDETWVPRGEPLDPNNPNTTLPEPYECDAEDLNGNLNLDGERDSNGNGILDPDEDTNGNGVVDGEDANLSGELEPNIPSLSPGEVVTNDQGIANFELIYPETEAAWARFEIEAAVWDSDNSAFTDTMNFLLSAAAEDIENDTAPPGGNIIGRYGSGPCP